MVNIVNIRAWMAWLVVVAFAGCAQSDFHEVTGRLTDRTGAPLPDIRVVFIQKNNSLTATAQTSADGTYRLGARRPGEGSPVGDYTVLVVEDVLDVDSARPRPPRIARKYSDPTLSGLEASVKPGRNRFDFQLDPQ
ncbi:MAG: carboxypeptidase-like regulatory domain-containing protein [Planctomycetia bacterium]